MGSALGFRRQQCHILGIYCSEANGYTAMKPRPHTPKELIHQETQISSMSACLPFCEGRLDPFRSPL